MIGENIQSFGSKSVSYFEGSIYCGIMMQWILQHSFANLSKRKQRFLLGTSLLIKINEFRINPANIFLPITHGVNVNWWWTLKGL